MTGGFWRTNGDDDLRSQLVFILRRLGGCLDESSGDVMTNFLAAGLFLLQALKWPLAKRDRKKRPSFGQLGSAQRTRLISHANESHLLPELMLLRPRAILAMGNAAWQACVEFIPGDGARLRKLGIRDVRGQCFEARLGSTSVPLGATLLPVDQNMRIGTNASLIRQDVEAFLTPYRNNIPLLAQERPSGP